MLLTGSKKRAQAATEYMMVAGLVALIIIPATFLFYRQASGTASQIDEAQINKFGREVVSAAETVYYMGLPSKIVIEERLPENVIGISVDRDPVLGTYLLAIAANTRTATSNFTYPTKVRLAGSFSQEEISAGIKKVRVEAGPKIGGQSFVAIKLSDNSSCGSTPSDSCIAGAQPSYCFSGVVVDNCKECGCGESIACRDDGTCAPQIPPVITGIEPSSGFTNGGTIATITGTGFVSGAGVAFGGASASVTFISSSQLTAVTPAHAVGTVDVTVTNPDGQSGTLSNGFAYTGPAPPPTITSLSRYIGPYTGGTTVTITGTGFVATPTVEFGITVASSVTFVSSSELRVVTPAIVAPGYALITVTNPDGQAALAPEFFLYRTEPVPIGTAFVTQSDFDPESWQIVGPGLAGADYICRAEASMFGFGGGTWRAWLSTTTLNAKDRIPDTTYRKLDNSIVANSKADLTDGSIARPINRASNGKSPSKPNGVWTGTRADGTFKPGDQDCNGWTSSSAALSARLGRLQADQTWTDYNYLPCNILRGLYCFRTSSQPTITGISPNKGATSGGTAITITGTEFINGLALKIGGSAATVNTVTSTSIGAVTPAGTPGLADVKVTNPEGGNIISAGGFTYQPQCNDGADNDNDGKTDYPADPGCTSLSDDDESKISGFTNMPKDCLWGIKGITPTSEGVCYCGSDYCSVEMRFDSFAPTQCPVTKLTVAPYVSGGLLSSNQFVTFEVRPVDPSLGGAIPIPNPGQRCCDDDKSTLDGDGPNDGETSGCNNECPVSMHSCTSYSGPWELPKYKDAFWFKCASTSQVLHPATCGGAYLNCKAIVNWEATC